MILHHKNGNCQSVPHAVDTVKRLSAKFVLKYQSIHSYQSTGSTENHWKGFRCQSENGIQYTCYLTRINIIIFYKQSLDRLSLKGKIQQKLSKWESYESLRERERERERERGRQTDRHTKNGGERERERESV